MPFKNSIFRSAVLLILFCCFFVLSCGDEIEPGEASLLPYNSAEHVYATVSEWSGNKWEVIIDPSTGQFEKILETEEIFGGTLGVPGSTELTAFERKERIYTDFPSDSELIIQSLDDFEKTTIEVRDETSGTLIEFPRFYRFGVDENEIYGLEYDKSVWKIHLGNQTVAREYNSFENFNGATITNFFFIKSSGRFLIATYSINSNSPLADYVGLYEPGVNGTLNLVAGKSIAEGFGFVQDPNDDESFYYIQDVNSETGYRLMNLEVAGVDLNVIARSSADLALDQAFPNQNTIHSARNTYIMRRGSSREGELALGLYSINLTSGVIVSEVDLNAELLLLNIEGE